MLHRSIWFLVLAVLLLPVGTLDAQEPRNRREIERAEQELREAQRELEEARRKVEEARREAAREARDAQREAQEAEREAERQARESERRGWLGFAFEEDDDRIRIVRVYPESPAARAGIRPGDRIVRLNGDRATQRTIQRLRLEPGDRVRLRIERDNRDREVTIVAGEREDRIANRDVRIIRPEGHGPNRVIIINGDTVHIPLDELMNEAGVLHERLQEMFADSLAPKLRALRENMPRLRVQIDGDTMVFFDDDDEREIARAARRLDRDFDFDFNFDVGQRSIAGAEFTPLNSELSNYFDADEGLLVLRVAPGTPADRAGLEAGDVVTRADGDRVDSVRELRRAITRASRGRDGEVVLDVVRKGREREVRLEWNE